MKKIKQLTFVLFIFSVLALSYPVTQVFAQDGGQCDSNPACDPTSGTCCNQCDPSPACNANDPNAIPCCSNNDMSQTKRHPYDKGRGDEHHDKGRGDEHHDKGRGDKHHDKGRGDEHHDKGRGDKHHDKGCEQMHPGGASKHIDPPQSQLDIIAAEYEASCKAGNCKLSDESYESLENQGHSRNEVDCFLAE